MCYAHIAKIRMPDVTLAQQKLTTTSPKGWLPGGKGVGGWVKKAEGNIVNNTVISLPGARRLLELVG